MLNEEMQYFAVEHVLKTYEEYFVVFDDFALSSTKFEYDVPSRAIGNKLRGIFYTDTSNNLSRNSFILSSSI